jgi:hypothetical protein
MIQNGISHGHGKNGIISKCATLIKEGKIRCPYVMPFIDRTNNVSCDCADHEGCLFFSFCSKKSLKNKKIAQDIKTSGAIRFRQIYLWRSFFETYRFAHRVD